MKVYPDVKINLGLNVLRNRPDGYHDLETLFVPFSGIRDCLEIVPSDKFRFVASENVTWDNDLTVQAYNLLKADYDLPPVEIRLTKNAPVGAGLGSGSSDCAYTLRMLNEMFSLGIGDAVLAEYASRLGSDCPFFIYDRPMIGEGRGEILTPFDLDLNGYEVKVSIPEGVHVSTREAYAGIKPHEPETPLREVLSLPVEKWRDALKNDFEPSVFAAHPEIAAIKDRFYSEGAVYSAMSGSGSAVFAIFAK